MSPTFDTASVLQKPSVAFSAVEAVHHHLKGGKDSNERTASDDRWDRKEIGRALAATSGNSISCRRKVDSFRTVGSQPEASWEFLLSWLISPRI